MLRTFPFRSHLIIGTQLAGISVGFLTYIPD